MPRECVLASVEAPLALSHPLKIAQQTLGILSDGRIELATCPAKVGIDSLVDLAVGSVRCWPALLMANRLRVDAIWIPRKRFAAHSTEPLSSEGGETVGSRGLRELRVR